MQKFHCRACDSQDVELLMELGPQPLSTPLKKGEVDKREWEPLAQGRIALQCEYSEVFYRKIEIRAIPDGALEVKRNK